MKIFLGKMNQRITNKNVKKSISLLGGIQSCQTGIHSRYEIWYLQVIFIGW